MSSKTAVTDVQYISGLSTVPANTNRTNFIRTSMFAKPWAIVYLFPTLCTVCFLPQVTHRSMYNTDTLNVTIVGVRHRAADWWHKLQYM